MIIPRTDKVRREIHMKMPINKPMGVAAG